jgi:MFS family permease
MRKDYEADNHQRRVRTMTRTRRLAATTFRSLRIRNFRLYFVGQLVSMTGTWMQAVAQGWLVLRLTHNSGSALGFVTALQFLPVLLFGAWSGVLADRFDKRRLLLCTQSIMAVFAALLAALTIGGVISLWMVYVLAFLTGLANAFDNPARQAFVSEMVGAEDLTNAISLNSAMFNGARVVGPALAGLAISLVDVGPCFAFNAVSFVAVLGSLWYIRTDELEHYEPIARAKRQVREGIGYAWRTPELRRTLVIVGIVGTVAFNFNVLLPLLAKVAFHGTAGMYGLMSSAMGLGALIGAMVTASRVRPGEAWLLLSCIAFGVWMVAAGLVPSLALALVMLVLMGAFMMAFMATANSSIQLIAQPSMRGRVMALYALVFLGSTPIGGPIVGYISQHFGPRFAFVLTGGITIVTGAVAGLSSLRTWRARQPGLEVAHPSLVLEPAAA